MSATMARLSEDRSLVLCGHQYPTGHYCATERNEPTVLARIDTVGDTVGGYRFAYFTSDWEVDDDRGIARRSHSGPRRELHGHAPTRRGWLRNIAGGMVRTRKSFALPTLVKCPQCGWLNTLDAAVLDIREVPLKS